MPASARLLLIVLGLSAVGGTARADDDDEPVDFRRQILPIFEGACVECHGAKKTSGALRLTGGVEALAGGISGKLVVPGKPGESYLLRRLRGEGDEDRMPLQRPPLSKKEIAVVARWIEEGAKVPPAAPTTFIPAPGGVRRLTVAQYRSSVRDLLGEVPVPVALEPDTLISGSAAVGAGRIVISRQATEKYALAAFRLAARATSDPAWWSRWLPCEASAGSPTCAAVFVGHFGERAFRRPLVAAETERYLALARRPPGGFVAGVRAVVAALLQSPSFLYRVELGVPDPADPSRRVLTDYEMASRLSFFLWGAPPDQELLDAAAAGRLSTDEGLRAQAERMLASPRSRATVETFFSELLRLGKLEHLPQFRSKYRQVSSTLGPAMREETLRVVEEIALDPERDFREIFDAPFTYVNGELARLYGVAPPADESAFVRVELPADGPRAGVLGQGSFLAVNAHPTAPSPTKRGRFIRETLLCQPVPPPPPDVSTKLPKDGKGPARTTRQKMAVHRTAVQCAGCHKAMDPLGLPFETYDGIGAFRERDNGLPIDASGELDGVPFRAPRELGALLRRSPKVGVCLARNLLRFALGHLEGEGEEPLVDELSQALERDGYHFRSLVLNVIASRGFRYVGEAAP
jgi:mono/diheme cytochrome c family protein